MKFKGLASVLIGCVLALTARAQTTRALSLEECIRIALEHNFDIQIARLNPDIAGFTLAGSYGSYDPTLSFSASHDYNLSPGGLDSENQPFIGTEAESDNLGGAIGGLLPWGLACSIGANGTDRWGNGPGNAIDLNNPTTVTNTIIQTDGTPINFFGTNYGTVATRNPFESSFAQVGALNLRQPLLRNFWIDNPRLQIFLNKKNLQISELGLKNQVITTVTAVEEAYYNLIYEEENIRVQEKGLELAERLVAENRRRVEVGALAPLDEKQAESQAAASRASLLDAKARRDTAERLLKSLLSDDYNEWKDAQVQPTDALLAVPQALDIHESWRRGMTRPDVVQARLGVEKQTRVVKYQKNQIYPQLDLFGNFGYTGSEQEFNGALGQIGNRNNPFYSYGVSITIPLANTSARNRLKVEKATQEQNTLDLKKLEQSVLILIENAMGNAQSSLERVAATKEARIFAEEALKAEQSKLEKGKSTSFVVLDLQSKLTTARSAEIRALADYNIDLARLALNEGSTLERRKIVLSVKN